MRPAVHTHNNGAMPQYLTGYPVRYRSDPGRFTSRITISSPFFSQYRLGQTWEEGMLEVINSLIPDFETAPSPCR